MANQVIRIDIPVDVQNLLYDHLDSYEALDILLLLRRELERACGVGTQQALCPK